MWGLTSVEESLLYGVQEIMEYRTLSAKAISVAGFFVLMHGSESKLVLGRARYAISYWRDLMGLETEVPVDHEVLNSKVFI